MAQSHFWMAALIAFIAWFATAVMATLRARRLSHSSSKSLCWFTPFLGMIAIGLLLYEGLYAPSGGYRSFAMGFVSLLFYALVPILIVAQLIFGFVARKMDAGVE